jgi:NAD(P)-dependent dehydrogenase (short-subunit alcohol dehydrogenase family)
MIKACIEAGAKSIVIFDANQDLGDAAAAELYKETGVPVLFYSVDIRDENAVNTALQSSIKEFGTPDVLINSAGIAE